MPSIIEIDPVLNQSDTIADFFDNLLDDEDVKVPIPNLVQIIESTARGGMSSDRVKNNVISRFSEASIPNSTLGEGTPNSMEILVGIIIEELITEIQTNARCDVALNASTILVQSATPSGPATGTNVSPSPASAIIS